jgi:hypothetical protein
MHHDLQRSGSKGLATMAMMIERISIIRKGLKLGVNLVKYDKPVANFTPLYTKKMVAETKATLERSMKLIDKIKSK